jgi:hypothetical protein
MSDLTRIEQYLGAIARDTIEGIPEEPLTRIEQYLDYIVHNGGGGGGDSYTKSETDALLALKANITDVYTKSAVDALLSAKANAADVYLKSDFVVDSAVTQQEITDSINNIWS